MQQGKIIGYSSKEVFAAVIKAIKPGSNLRNYLESRVDISETAFIQVLRNHFIRRRTLLLFSMNCQIVCNYIRSLNWIFVYG